MFYYYGRKKQLARHYPPPRYPLIVEPFAGSAAYALHENNWRREVLLIEKDERVAAIWEWLIRDATPAQVERLPDLKVGDRSSEFLHIVHAATKMAFHYRTIKVTPVLARNWEISKRVIASSLHKVRHWTVVCADYSAAPDVEATWFIDPPYKHASGQGYRHGSAQLDYAALASWVTGRRGEVICCEGENGDYLPFEPLEPCRGVAGKVSQERVYFRASDELEPAGPVVAAAA